MSVSRTFPILVFVFAPSLLLAGCSKPAPVVPADAPSPSVPAAAAAKIQPTPHSSLAHGTEDAGPVPSSFKALGTEPFWSATYALGKLTWSTPEQPEGVTVPARRIDTDGKATVTARIEGLLLELEVRRETCSDGMSDTVYPLSVKRRLGKDVQGGCAR